MLPLRATLPLVLAAALLAPAPAPAHARAAAPALTQSTTPALACLTESTVTGCAVSAEMDGTNGTIDTAALGADIYLLRGFPNTAFVTTKLLRLRLEGSAYVVKQCLSAVASAGCVTAPKIANATRIAASSKRLYLATGFPNNAANGSVGGVSVVPRDPATGVLTAPTECRSAVATTAQGCTVGDPLGTNASGIAVTPDGTGLYVTGSGGSSRLLTYDLAPDGDLDTAPACVASAATSGCTTNATSAQDAALEDAGALDVSGDGRHVYAATGRGTVAFARSTTAGPTLNDLAFASCLSNDPDASECAAFPAGLRFADGLGHAGATAFVLTTFDSDGPSGTFPGSVLLLQRSTTTGALSIGTCLARSSVAGCTTFAGLGEPSRAVIAPDAKSVHVSSLAPDFTGQVLTLAVSGSTLAALPGTDGCLKSGAATASCAGGMKGATDEFSASFPLTVTGDAGTLVLGSFAGAAFLTRQAVTAPTAPVALPKPPPTVRLDRARKVRVPVRCTGSSTCRGRLTLTSAGKIRPTPTSKPRKVTFGSGTFTVGAGRTVTVTLTLSRANANVVKRLGKVRCTATATITGGASRTAPTVLKPPKG